MSAITKLTELCPSKYLESADFEGDTPATIKSWAIETVGPDEDECGILYFDEFKRGLVLNKTKKTALLNAFGNNLEDFKGKTITLFPTEVMAFGSMKPAIGIRIPKNQ